MSGTSGSAHACGVNAAQPKRSVRMLFAVLAVCAAPIAASYFTYYVVRPDARTNYGELIEPQRPLPAAGQLPAADLQGRPFDLQRLRGNWLMVMVEPSPCYDSCRGKLYWMRQLKAAQGRDRDRIDRVWFLVDQGRPAAELLGEYDGTVVLRAPRAALQDWLQPAAGGAVEDHLYLLDPQGNYMMRFPKDADANRIKRDLARLLRASASWQQPRPPRAEAP